MKLPYFNLYHQLRPIIFLGDPEKMHSRMLSIVEKLSNFSAFFKFLHYPFNEDYNNLQTDLFKISLNNPIGLAAGFDKDGRIFNALFGIGFSFVEIGTVTPQPQFGNRKPRIARLVKDKALINSLGFNNHGALEMSEKLKNLKNRIKLEESLQRPRYFPDCILGINIGKNKITPIQNASKDYVNVLKVLYPFADYFTLNLSSPNTKDLGSLQKGDALNTLLENVCSCRDKLDYEHSLKTPILLKLSPDLKNNELDESIQIIKNFSIQGIIATNTTTEIEVLSNKVQTKKGGLSGKPLQKRSTNVIRKLFKELGNDLTIIGVGGIFSGSDAYEKIKAGASAVQIYTALVYEGPALVKKIKHELAQLLEKDGFKKISDAVGIEN